MAPAVMITKSARKGARLIFAGGAGSLAQVAGEYTIAAGLADAQRLARQARVMEAATSAFLAYRPGAGLGVA